MKHETKDDPRLYRHQGAERKQYSIRTSGRDDTVARNGLSAVGCLRAPYWELWLTRVSAGAMKTVPP